MDALGAQRIPDTTTAEDFTRRFKREEIVTLMEWIDRAIGLVKPHAVKVCLRGDTDFSLTENFDRWAKEVDFV